MKLLYSLEKKLVKWLGDSWILITLPAFFGLLILIYVRSVYWKTQFADYLCILVLGLFLLHVDKKWESVKEKERSRSNSPPKK